MITVEYFFLYADKQIADKTCMCREGSKAWWPRVTPAVQYNFYYLMEDKHFDVDE